ncbi:protein white-like [Patiria miniata]|uniref:ABC transporter domain-containing protein n=1 Tax=Patiria miniata TaxID=46514 RepID=A0A913Z0G3_PATMI|nr:protein white-like [Patiria miniata]
MDVSTAKKISSLWSSFKGWSRNRSDDRSPILTSAPLEGESYTMEDVFRVAEELQSMDPPGSSPCPETGIQEPIIPVRRRRRGSFIEIERRITLLWSDVWVETKVKRRGKICETICGRREEQPKVILRGVSGFARPGNLIAVMGASGAGKSTLMNVLTQHNLGSLEVRGQVSVTDSIEILPCVGEVSTYIQQEDVFVGSLTVREHLLLQAKLRMSREISLERKMERVEDILEQLSLVKCADARIGNPTTSDGISAGERKRLSFASELLTNPPLLFCDEPTSGLDSYMSQILISMLRQLALEGHTILCSIHQPSSDVYSMFDRLILMADGRCAYQGDIDKAVEYFARLGYQSPDDYCPADFFIDTLSIRPGDEENCNRKVDVLCDAFSCSAEARVIQATIEEEYFQARTEYESSDDIPSRTRSSKASYWQQFSLLLWRCAIDVFREPSLLKSYLVTSIGLGVFLGLLYLNQPYNQSSIQNINGFLFLLVVQISTTTPARVAAVIPNELPLIVREHRGGTYSSACYFLARVFIEVVTHVSQSLITIGIAYYMIGLNRNIFCFLVAVGTTALMTITAVSFGVFLSVASPTSEIALNLMIPIFFLFTLFGGFYMNPLTTPVYFIWVRFVSWYPAVFEILQVNQWATIENLDCELNSTLPCLENGEQVLDKYGYDQDNFVLDVLLVVLMTLGYLMLGGIVIRMRLRGER